MEHTKQNIVEAFRSSGQTQQQFCTTHDISIERLRYYLYKKGSRKTADKSKQLKPTFITFAPTESSQHCTIIHGTFTASSLAALVKELRSL
jgi:hypothetical protein